MTDETGHLATAPWMTTPRADGRASGTPRASGTTCLGRTAGLAALLWLGATGCTETHHARVENGAGVSEGSPVLVSGVPVGQVKSIRVVEGEVDVAFQIDSDHEVTLRVDSCALTTAGDGAPALVLIPGSGAPLPEGQSIPQCQPAPGMGGLFGQLGDSVGQLLQQLGQGMFNGGAGGSGTGGSGTGSGGSGGSGAGAGFPFPLPPPPPRNTAPPSGSSAACDAVRVVPDGVETVAPTPLVLESGGHRVWLRFSNDGDENVEIGAIGNATFTDAAHGALRPATVPGEAGAWFMPFAVPAHGSARASVVFEGTRPPRLDVIEVRGSGCTVRADGLASR